MKYIYGLGKSGFSIISFLENIKEDYICWDDNKIIRNKILQYNNKIKFLKPEKLNLKLIKEVFITPGISFENKKLDILKKNNIKFSRDLNMYLNHLGGNEKIIAITGTNGKSTTTKLIGDILRFNRIDCFVGGNIGLPLMESKINHNSSIYHVIELSSYQLESSENFNPFVSILLNLSPDHLDRYSNIEEYINQKQKIISSNKNSYNVISLDDKYCRNIFEKSKSENFIPISKEPINEGVFFSNNKIVDNFFHKSKILNIPKISKSLFGKINQENILASYVVSEILKLDNNNFFHSVGSFVGLPHRLEEIINNKKMLIINNSKATNIDASLKSIENYQNIYLVLGGLAKEDNFIKFNKFKRKINKIYLIGKSKKMILNQLKDFFDIEIFNNLDDAIKKLIKDAIKKNKKFTLLFSPACSSFDQYSNFENRGNSFKKIIKTIIDV